MTRTRNFIHGFSITQLLVSFLCLAATVIQSGIERLLDLFSCHPYIFLCTSYMCSLGMWSRDGVIDTTSSSVCCCLQTCNSVINMLVMGLVLGPRVMVISIMGILLSQSTVVLCI